MSTIVDRQDGLSSATAFKGPCRVATTANITLEGLQTIDGISVSAGDRVLVRGQTDARDNGIYKADTGLWPRAKDFSRNDDVQSGTRVGVVYGSTYARTTFEVTTANPIYVGTSSITLDIIETSIAAGFVAVADVPQLAALSPAAGAAIILDEDTGGIAAFQSGDFSGEIADGDPRYVEQDSTDPSDGAWVFLRYPTAPIVDRTRPLIYEDFYRWKGREHNAAMAALFEAMFTSGSSLFRSHVDLQGARIELEEPVAPTGGGNNLWHMSNGRFLASTTSWSGTYMLDLTAASGQTNFKLINCEFDAQEQCHWLKSDGVAVIISNCLFEDNLDDGNPGMFMADGGHVKIYNGTRFSSPDQDINPNVRNRVALRCEGGDQKVFDSIFNYFKYGMIFEGFATTIGNCHVYQGTSELLTGHTAGIKFTTGTAGALLTNVYLDKCFVEVSNEDDTSQVELGGVTATGIHTALQSDDTGFAFFQARDYGGHTNAAYVTRMTITNGEYRNLHATTVNLTKLYNPSAFDPSLNDQIIVDRNNFYNCTPQFSTPRMKKTFTAATQHTFDFSGYTPFNSQIKGVLGVTGLPSSGGNQPLDIGNINASSKTVRIDTNANWAGDITVTAAVNSPDSNGLIVG